jgi:predicted metal-dependent peptidase
MKLTVEQRIERAHVKLMQDPDCCLFSGVFMVGKVQVSEVVPTAYTNGKDVTYGRSFVEGLSDPELNFVVLHETMHKAYRHLFVYEKLAKQNMRLANMAMDYVINLQLMDMKKPDVIQMPKDKNGKTMGLLDEQYRGMDTKQVFDILKKEQENCDGGGGVGVGGQQDDESGCLDDHGWAEAKDLTEEEKEVIAREIDQALREGAILAGKLKGNVSREIQELLHPKVDWREALREFIKSTMMGNDQSTWRKPSRKFIAQGIVMPSTYSEKAGQLVVGVDTSGSIGGEELAQFLGEVKSICDEVCPEALDILYWDSEVAKHEHYEGHEVSNAVESTKPAGGGGTMPGCVPVYMKDKQITPQCVVMLTDGYFFEGGSGEWGGVEAPVLWCVKGNKRFNPTVGQSIYVEV